MKFNKKLIVPVLAAGVLLPTTQAFAYEVQPGDTMSEIAKEHNISLSKLSSLNPQVENIHLIYVGQEIDTNGKQLNESAKVVEKQKTKTKTVTTNADSNEIDLLARLVRAEARGESFEGKVAVAEVVLNRVKDKRFPDSITGVIYQKSQFSPVTNGSINKPADEESIRAVNEALSSSSDITGGAVFFYNPDTASSRWLDSKSTTAVIGNHNFKK